MASTRPSQPSYIRPAFEDAKVRDAMRVGLVTGVIGASGLAAVLAWGRS
jgi:hypothetical protein